MKTIFTETGAYAVIYDTDESPTEDSAEQYYGYFSDPEQALDLFEKFAHGQTLHNAQLVRVVGYIS